MTATVSFIPGKVGRRPHQTQDLRIQWRWPLPLYHDRPVPFWPRADGDFCLHAFWTVRFWETRAHGMISSTYWLYKIRCFKHFYGASVSFLKLENFHFVLKVTWVWNYMRVSFMFWVNYSFKRRNSSWLLYIFLLSKGLLLMLLSLTKKHTKKTQKTDIFIK